LGAVVPGRVPFDVGDRVRVLDGTFTGMDGVVEQIIDPWDKVRLELTIFGRPIPVELDFWQLEKTNGT
jgi:transcription termination/antitermination protein NusG